MIELPPHSPKLEMSIQFVALNQNKELWSFVRAINEEYLLEQG